MVVGVVQLRLGRAPTEFVSQVQVVDPGLRKPLAQRSLAEMGRVLGVRMRADVGEYFDAALFEKAHEVRCRVVRVANGPDPWCRAHMTDSSSAR